MKLSLTQKRPDDLYGRMEIVVDGVPFGTTTPVEPSVDGGLAKGEFEPAYIEFWDRSARACKGPFERLEAEMYAIQKRQDARGKESMSTDEALGELQTLRRLTIEALAHRVRGWRLVDHDGQLIEAPVTFENAKELFTENPEIRDLASAFVAQQENFTQRPVRSS